MEENILMEENIHMEENILMSVNIATPSLDCGCHQEYNNNNKNNINKDLLKKDGGKKNCMQIQGFMVWHARSRQRILTAVAHLYYIKID